MVREIMPKSISRTRKKRGRGRPPTGAMSIHLRVLPSEVARVDAWIAKHPSPKPTRPEAIRRLIGQALAPSPQTKPTKSRKAQEALELAERTAERLVDKSMPPEEQQRRKRALMKGPKEFRDIREDLPKPKTKGAD